MNAQDFLSQLPEKFPVEVRLNPISGEPLSMSGMAGIADSGTLKIDVEDQSLLRGIDHKSECLVFIDSGERATLICAFRESPGGDALHVRVLESIRHGGSEKREFFRGPAGRIAISVNRRTGDAVETFRARGINISCGGILLMVSRKLRKSENLEIVLRVPEPVNKSHHCIASVLRVSQINETTYTTAAKFLEIESDACDDIMAFCFAEERQRIKDYVLPSRA